ncbi:MAG: SPOR domain-containing protein [Flavobacteriales bacterium]
MKITCLFIFLIISQFIYSQNISFHPNNDNRIDSLANRQIELNNQKKGIDGFRVQIHHNQSQSREASQKVRANFSKDFPNLKTYLEFKSPYYKIQVGDFTNRLEAYKVQKEISKKYKGSYIVPALVIYE